MFGFIIPCHVTTLTTYRMIESSIDKIREFHQEPIVLIDDCSTFDLTPLTQRASNLTIETSDSPRSGELNPYLYYHKHCHFETAVIIHDSMQLMKKLEISHVSDVQFIRIFTEHTRSWSHLDEPQTPYNVIHGIKKHDDLNLHLLDVCFKHKSGFYTFAKNVYHRKNEWIGCFGVMSIINHSFLNKLQDNTGILDCAWRIKDKRDRCALESLFPIACLYTLTRASASPWRVRPKWSSPLEHLQNSYDGDQNNIDNNTKYSFQKLTLAR